MTDVELTNINSNGVNFYQQVYDQYPILSAEQEYELAMNWHTKQCHQSAQRLILSHIRFVVFIASKYDWSGAIRDDLIQQGIVGLMKAVKLFDPTKGVRLVSYAVVAIKSEIHQFLLCNHSIVKIATTKADRKLFFNLRKLKGDRVRLERDEIEEIANQLNVKPEEVIEMDKRLWSFDVSYDPISVETHDDQEPLVPNDVLADPNGDVEVVVENDQWNQVRKDRLQQAIKTLPERNQQIIEKRWLVDSEEKATLQDLSEIYGVSKERIRQIEHSSIKQLQQLMM